MNAKMRRWMPVLWASAAALVIFPCRVSAGQPAQQQSGAEHMAAAGTADQHAGAAGTEEGAGRTAESTGAAAGKEEGEGKAEESAGTAGTEEGAGGTDEKAGTAENDAGTDGGEGAADVEQEAEELLSRLELSKLDDYMRRQNLGELTFSELVKDLFHNGLPLDFSSAGEKLKQIVLKDYADNRSALVQIITLSIAFSILMQMTSSKQRSYLSDLGFLGVYLIMMMLLLRLFLMMTGIVEDFFTRLVEFMQMLQPAFCMSMVFSTGSMSAGVYYQLLLMVIYLVDVVFAKVLLPAVQIHMVLQLVNNMMEEQRFSRITGLLADSVHGCVKVFTTAVIGLNIVQGLLAPGIDGLKRSTFAGAVRVVPGAGQVMNSLTEILAGSAMLIKNSVGAAALVILLVISFLPLVKITVFMVLYRGCAAIMEPVSDKRFCAAVAALGQSAALYLKLMFYAVLLFFLTTAVICAATTLSAA